MRKIAREAVIFCLLGSILVIIGSLLIAKQQDTGAAKSAAMRAVHAILPPPAGFIPDPSPGIRFVTVPLTNGPTLYVKQCFDVRHPPGQPADIFDSVYEQDHDCRYFSHDPADEKVEGLPPGAYLLPIRLSIGNPNQLAIEKDYWTAYRTAKRGQTPENLMVSALAGFLYGFPAGFGVWCLYRLVRFAVMG